MPGRMPENQINCHKDCHSIHVNNNSNMQKTSVMKIGYAK